jgi:hypothetical protein
MPDSSCGRRRRQETRRPSGGWRRAARNSGPAHGLFQRAGSSSGANGRFASGAKTLAISSSDAASACSLTTAAALRSTGCCAACLRSSNSRPAIVADFRFAPGFQRADFGEPRAQLHRESAAPRPSCRSGSRRSAARACAGRRRRGEFHHVAQLVVGARERAVQRNETGRLATSCSASLSISMAAPSSAPRGTRHTAENCRRAPRPAPM